MECQTCGAELKKGVKVCEYCGQPVPAKKSRKWIFILAAVCAALIACACVYALWLAPFIRSFTQNNTFLYAKDGTHYFYNGRRAKEVTDSGEVADYMNDAITPYLSPGEPVPSGEELPFEYRLKSGEGIDATRLVEDPYLEEDAALTEPNREDFKKTGTFFGFEFETYDNAAFNEAQQAYLKKLERDGIREALKSVQIKDARDVYYYDAQTEAETLLLENVLVRETAAIGDDTLLTAVMAIPLEVFPDAMVSIDNLIAEGTGDLLAQYLGDYMKETEVASKVILGTEVCPAFYRQNDAYLLDVPNKNLYHLERKEDFTARALERIPLSADGKGKRKTIDEDFDNAPVSAIPGYSVGERFYYWKNLNETTQKGVLMLEGKVIAQDVRGILQYHDRKTGGYEDVLYIKQGENAVEEERFTLSRVENKRVTVLCEDAREIRRLEDKSFAVLKSDGTLVRVTRSGRAKEIDSEVTDLYGGSGVTRNADVIVQEMKSNIKEE